MIFSIQSTMLPPSPSFFPHHGPCKVCLLAPCRHTYAAYFLLIIFPPFLLRLYMLACFSLPNSTHLLCRAKMAATAREKIQESERGNRPLSHFLLRLEWRHQHALTCMAPVGSDVGSTIVVDKTFCRCKSSLSRGSSSILS